MTSPQIKKRIIGLVNESSIDFWDKHPKEWEKMQKILPKEYSAFLAKVNKKLADDIFDLFKNHA